VLGNSFTPSTPLLRVYLGRRPFSKKAASGGILNLARNRLASSDLQRIEPNDEAPPWIGILRIVANSVFEAVPHSLQLLEPA
jgi:hypothetical protein